MISLFLIERKPFERETRGFHPNIDWDFSIETFKVFNLINFELSAGTGLSHILYGEQKIGSSIYKLRENNEFDGFFVRPFAEFGSNFYNSKKVSAGLFLNLSKSFSIDNNSKQKLDFENFQIKLRLCVN